MQDQILSTQNPIFNLYAPLNGEFIGVLSIPHSGEIVPELFEEYLTSDVRARREDVDTAVDQLVDIKRLQENGIAVIVAHIQRVCVDLNRSPDLCVLNWKKNSHGIQLVTKEPSKELEEELIGKYHTPYFETLKSLIETLKIKTQKASFIDLHSMPSKPTAYHLSVTPNQALTRPDFCVSDIIGKSCEKDFIDFVCDKLSQHYPQVNQNDPYFGGFITRHTDALFPDINNIQIEINRANYLDEKSKELIPEKANKMKNVLTEELLKTFKTFFEKYQR